MKGFHISASGAIQGHHRPLVNFSIYKSLMKKKKKVPKIWQEVKVKVDIITSDDIKIYYTGKFQDITARYIINLAIQYLAS